MLNKQKIEVRTEGQLVILNLGNVEVKMEYETALQLSTWMRVRGKEAKANAGDHSRRWNVVGNLDAILHGQRPW